MSYGPDLAWIHHTGFGEFAAQAAGGIVGMLRTAGIEHGLVVELGCGSGIVARHLTDAGYEVLGTDASPAMIELARCNAPAATFETARFGVFAVPPCTALIAAGEVLNYGTIAEVEALVQRAAAALPAKGLLIFDVAERGSPPLVDALQTGGDDWHVIAVKESDGRTLTRRVLTFRQTDGRIHRSDETHVLELYDRAELLELLRRHGFAVRVRRSYGSYRLPRGHAVYLARRRA